MKDPQLGGIAKALAAHGRHGDDTLIHVSRKELEQLQKYSDELGIHLTVNPATGLPEAFNWGGMIGSVGIPLLLTVASGGTLGPLALAAAGAAGGFGGTLMGGGSTDQALMSGVMGGIGGFGMGGIGEGLAQAGTEKLAEEAAANVAKSTVESAATDATTNVGQNALQNLTQNASQNSGILNSLATQGGENLAQGMTPAAGSMVNGAFVPTPTPPVPLQSTPMTGTQLMGKGWESVSSSPQSLGNFASAQAKNIGMAGIGAIGAGSLNPQEQTITTEPSTSNEYSAEWYVDPATGQRRTRAVRKAEGGEIYGQYDGVEEAADGGYIPGGGLNFAGGGGIGALGTYSDGGRMLRGPGDGVSDSIPASIENKRPARLADGEFVVPARAVSELGNGSTEAGSKQLYAMLDRIAAKRKKGKGLAYQANPRKLMPV